MSCIIGNVELHMGPPRMVGTQLHGDDQRVVVAGSFNYTDKATLLNDENIVVIGHPTKGDSAAQRRFAMAAWSEIDMIIKNHSKPYVARS